MRRRPGHGARAPPRPSTSPLNAPVAIVDRAVVEAGVRALIASGVYRGDVVRLDITLS